VPPPAEGAKTETDPEETCCTAPPLETPRAVSTDAAGDVEKDGGVGAATMMSVGQGGSREYITYMEVRFMTFCYV